MAIFPQPGVVQSFAEQGDLIEIEDIAGDEVDANYGTGAREAGSVDGTLYGVWFRAAQKSTVWYNVDVFEGAGVEPPTTFEELQQVAQTISDYGVEPYSIGADVGWPLSDLFENIYLRTAGPDMYDQLAAHEIPWTDQSVKDALTVMADILGDESLLAGGATGAEQTDFNGSVTQVFADPPKGAIIFEGDFVGGIISGETKAEVGHRCRLLRVPLDRRIGACGARWWRLRRAVGRHRRRQGTDRVPRHAGSRRDLGRRGGFISPNTQVDTSVYPDEVSQRAAQALVDAGESVRYDLSDLQPTEFGATTGQGIWGMLIDFLRDPSDVDGTAQALESAAKKAYGGVVAMDDGARAAAADGRGRVAVPRPGPGAAGRHRRLPDLLLGRAELLRCERRRSSSASRTTRRCSRRRRRCTAIKNNLIWVVFAPSIVTALGLVFAVLTERIAWSTAFKVAIFMPMAISFLSAGVTWRLIYEQDPDLGLANAAAGAVGRTSSGRPASCRAPARRRSRRCEPPATVASDARIPSASGETAAFGLVAIPPESVPDGAVQAVEPTAADDGIAGTVWLDFAPGGGGEPGEHRPRRASACPASRWRPSPTVRSWRRRRPARTDLRRSTAWRRARTSCGCRRRTSASRSAASAGSDRRSSRRRSSCPTSGSGRASRWW